MRNEKLIFLFLNQNICCGHINSYNSYKYKYLGITSSCWICIGTWSLRSKSTKALSDNSTKEVQFPSQWSYKTLVHGYASVLMILVINHLHANCLLWLQNINGSNMSLIRMFSRTILKWNQKLIMIILRNSDCLMCNKLHYSFGIRSHINWYIYWRTLETDQLYIHCLFHMVDLRMFSLSLFIRIHNGPWFAIVSIC